MSTDTPDRNTVDLAEELPKWLRKPFRTNGYVLFDMSIFAAFIIAAIITQIWWLLIPVLVVAQSCGLFFASIVSEVLREKDAEIQRLRKQLEAV